MATLTHLDFVDALRHEVGKVSSLLAAADLAAPVPPCPGWQVRDLVGHLGGVHRWVSEIVRTGERARLPASPDDGALPAWYDDGAEALVQMLALADPARACWTLAPPHDVGFWSRRQVLETMIHRWDLATAVGAPTEFSPALATDGIDEAVTVMFPRQVRLARLAPLSDAVALVDVGSGRRWVLTGDGTSNAHDTTEVDATVSGDAGQLLLMLWKRVGLTGSDVRVVGDDGAVRRVLGASLTP